MKCALIVLSIVIAALAIMVRQGLFLDEELANKPEWSTLQAALLLPEAHPTTRIIVKRSGSFDLIGIKAEKSERRVWILANLQAPPSIKVMPNNLVFRLSVEELAKLSSEVRMNEETRSLLRNAVGAQ